MRDGSADIFYLRCQVSEKTSKIISDDFETKLERNLSYSDGTGWSISGGTLSTSGICKRLWGSYTMGDYTFSVKATPKVPASTFGLLVRATNPGDATFASSDGMSIDTTDIGAKGGANRLQGYYIQFTKSEVAIYKINYNASLGGVKKASTLSSLSPGKEYTMTVSCEGSTITVYVDGNKVCSYTDPEPYICGMAGLRCSGAGKVTFDDLSIIPIN